MREVLAELNMRDVIAKTKKSLATITNLEFSGVISISKDGSEWKVIVELVERKSIPDTSDILGVYEIRLDDEGEIVGFNRTRLRKRGETQEENREGI